MALSTYAGFEPWMMDEPLAIPDDAHTSWHPYRGEAGPESVTSVPNRALEINKQSHPAYSGLTTGGTSTNSEHAWSNSNTQLNSESDDRLFSSEITTTIGMLNRFIGG